MPANAPRLSERLTRNRDRSRGGAALPPRRGLLPLTPDEDAMEPLRPSEAQEPGAFDKFATAVADKVARAWFFAFCVVLVLIWAPSYFVIGDVDTWQLIINTATTIITFLMVALLQNTQSRDARAIHRKLNAIADGLADLMETHEAADDTLNTDRDELREAVGLEKREGS